MKTVIRIFIIGLLSILCGCDKNESVSAYAPSISFRFVDNEGKIVYFNEDGTLSFHDNKTPYSEINKKYNNINSLSPLEIISITDNFGRSLQYDFKYNNGSVFRLDPYRNRLQTREYEYTIKYKIPLLKGESVEELKLKLKENEYGHPIGWYDCQYNGKSIYIYTIEEIIPDCHDPQRVIDEEKSAERYGKTLYSGNLVALGSDSGSINVFIPIDI